VAYLVDTTGGSAATEWVQRLRAAGIPADRAYDGRSMKSQVRSAAKSGARFAVILGEAEVAAGEATVRDLQSSDQVPVPLAAPIDHLRKATQP
jgi:histidyl-tRNA synthetase